MYAKKLDCGFVNVHYLFQARKTIKMSTRRLFTEVATLACFLLPLVFPDQCPFVNTAKGFRAVCPTHHLLLCVSLIAFSLLFSLSQLKAVLGLLASLLSSEPHGND